MDWTKSILSAVSAVLLSLFLPTLLIIPRVIKSIREGHATGFGLLFGGFSESLSSPRFWIFAVLFLILFLAASRIGNRALMLLLFWVPAILVATLGLMSLSLVAFVFIRSRGH
jgi:hypothetical protein